MCVCDAYVMLCYAMLCSAMRCHAMPCHAMFGSWRSTSMLCIRSVKSRTLSVELRLGIVGM